MHISNPRVHVSNAIKNLINFFFIYKIRSTLLPVKRVTDFFSTAGGKNIPFFYTDIISKCTTKRKQPFQEK